MPSYCPAVATALDRFFRNPKTGRLVIAQPPNIALGIFLIATAVRVLLDPEGTAGTVTSVVRNLSLGWWAVDEVVRGESPFRRVLGAVVLVALVRSLVVG